MKVGVITFHSANNYGATLQTWALQKVLREYGLDAGVIHYHPDIIDNLYDPMEGSRGIKRSLKRLRITMNNPVSLARYDRFQEFLKKNFNLIGDFRTYQELKDANLDLDAYIVGSDQVWNVEHSGGYDPTFFLEFSEPGKKRIAYAASVGSDYIQPRYKVDFRRALESFTSISVRERSIAAAVKDLTDRPVDIVLDPTLLLQKDDYEEIKVPSKIRDPYILVYMIERNEQVIALANQISIALGIPLIQRRPTRGFKNELPPFYTEHAGEFIGLIEGASYVITNSFHGTVFSIIYERPFVSMLHSDTGSRTVDLLTELKLQSHILYNIAEFKEFNMFQIEDPEKLRKRIHKLMKSSTEFLVKSLGLSDKYDMVQCPTGITKEQCYGCYACKEICPVAAIQMEEDKEGFFYPVVDKSKCIDCGLCHKTCIRNKDSKTVYAQSYPKSYCAYHQENDIRKNSSSGAVFPALAKYIIEEKKGFVVGVRYDENMNVISDIAQTMEEVNAFRGSKYVKSDFDHIFPRIKELLKQGKYVLYSGLPCECAGLRSYLTKEYENLILCEILCHSVPSPKIFRQFVKHLNEKYHSRVVNIVFRDKNKGWKPGDSDFIVTLENGSKQSEVTADNLYYRAFLNDYITRPVCTNCNYVYDNRTGDFTIGDCWGIGKAAPELNDNKGVNLVMVNNSKGMEIWEKINHVMKFKESNIESIFIKNHKKPIADKRERTAFFLELDHQPVDQLLTKYFKK